MKNVLGLGHNGVFVRLTRRYLRFFQGGNEINLGSGKKKIQSTEIASLFFKFVSYWTEKKENAVGFGPNFILVRYIRRFLGGFSENQLISTFF